MVTQLGYPLIDASTIGGRLRQVRRLRDMTQSELADAIHVSRESVSMWERCKASPSTDALIEVAKAVHMPVAMLVDGLDGQEMVLVDRRWASWDSNPRPMEQKCDEQQLTFTLAA